MSSSEKTQLMHLFNDPTYAWELLEWEIAIQMNDSLSGKAIAHLLELYMKGVEKMNSLMDVRQSYFKNKVTSLMMKGNVVKTLNKPPMAKKDKHLEVVAKKEQKSKKVKNEVIQQKKEEEESPSLKPTIPNANVLALQEKRKEIEMRLAYEADSSSRENLATLYHQHLKKEESFNKKVTTLLKDHESKLQERISRRKLRTATYRSRPEDTSDTFPVQLSPQPMRVYESPFSPRDNQKQGQNKQKRYRSVEVKAIHDLKLESPTRKPRKNTHDLTESKKEDEDRTREIDTFQEFKKAIEQARKRQDQQVIEMVLSGDLPGCEKSPEQQEQEKHRQSI